MVLDMESETLIALTGIVLASVIVPISTLAMLKVGAVGLKNN